MKHNELADKRIVAYSRVSTDLQDSDNQEATIERYAKRNGVVIQKWYKDNEGVNPRGDGLNRPQWERMYADAKAGQFDAILVSYQKRLGLIGHAFGHWIFMFKQEGVSIYDALGNNLSSQDSATIEKTTRDTIASQEWLIEHGIKILNARIKSGQEGDYHGGIPPYYCDVVCYDSTLTHEKYRFVYHNRTDKTQYIYNAEGEEIDKRDYFGKGNRPQKDKGDRLRLAPTMLKERLEITRMIFNWFYTESINLSQIAGRLNQKKIPALYRPYWTATGVKSFMLNPAVIGKPAQCKIASSRYAERYEDGCIDRRQETLIGLERTKENVKLEEWVMPDKEVFSPIIPEDVFWATRKKLLSNRRGASKPSRKAIAWLKGFVYCATCGRPLNFQDRKVKAKGKTFRYVPHYRCSTYQSKGNQFNSFGCQSNYIKASVLEELVEHYLMSTQQNIAMKPMLDKRNIAIEPMPVSPI